jgi:hypothetical protein
MDVGVDTRAVHTATTMPVLDGAVDAVAPLRGLRRLLAAGGALLVLGALAVAVVDIAGADVPGAIIRLTISQAGLTPLAPVFAAAVLAIAAGGAAVLAVAVGLRRSSRLPSVRGAVAGVIAIVGFVLVAVFTKQDWSQPPAVSGTIHRVGSLAAFLALPVAVIALARRAWASRRIALAAVVAAIAGMASFLPIVVAIVAVGMSGGWWLVVPLGLIERIIALCDIAALMLLAVLCRQEMRGRQEMRAPGRVLV